MLGRSIVAWVAVGTGMIAINHAAEQSRNDLSPGRSANTATTQEPTSAAKKNDKRLIRLAKDQEVWIDRQRTAVIVGGQVCLREGPLEMFSCPKHTNEHESIVSVNTTAYIIHAALLAIGAQVGKPVSFEPKYTPAAGVEIAVEIVWKDQHGQRHSVPAQQWVRNADTRKSLEHPWVVVGSGFWTDPSNGRRYYHAEVGELICVSNFSTAMMDLPIPSSQTNEQLLYEAYTERIPPIGTKVQLFLRPKTKANGARKAGNEGQEP